MRHNLELPGSWWTGIRRKTLYVYAGRKPIKREIYTALNS